MMPSTGWTRHRGRWSHLPYKIASQNQEFVFPEEPVHVSTASDSEDDDERDGEEDVPLALMQLAQQLFGCDFQTTR